MPVASVALRHEEEGQKAVPVEGNLLLRNPEKNDEAIMRSLCECGGVRHGSSLITPSRLRSSEVNRQPLGSVFKARVCVARRASASKPMTPLCMSFTACQRLPDSWILLFWPTSSSEHTDRGVKGEAEHEKRVALIERAQNTQTGGVAAGFKSLKSLSASTGRA